MRLEETELLRGVGQDTLARLKGLAVVRTLPQSALLCSAGDSDAPVILVLAGALRVYKADADGREQTVATLGVGEALNLPAAFADDRRAPANVEALTPEVTVASIPAQALAELAATDATLAATVIRSLANSARHLSDLVTDLSLRSVRQRLARFLLLQAEQADGGGTSRWTHAEIATQLGTAREVVSRQLRALVQEGLVLQDRQRLVIADTQALRRLADL